MKKCVLLLLVGIGSGLAGAQERWFTVVGDPRDPQAETVQVDPTVMASVAGKQQMNMRVNRASKQRSREGICYRSFESTVAVDCAQSKADYLTVHFYAEPLWRGTPHATTRYVSGERPMTLADTQPNPKERLIRAACHPRNAARDSSAAALR